MARREKIWNIPNILTILRIIIAISLVFLLEAQKGLPDTQLSPWNGVALALFIIAGVSDFVDGYLARHNNWITNFGKLFDPLADKFLIAFSLIMLTDLQRVPGWITVILIGRDIAVTGLRGIASEMGVVIAAAWSGKFKTLAELLAVGGYIYWNDLWIINGARWGDFFIYIAIVLALWSGFDYFAKFWRVITEEEEIEEKE